MGEYIKRESVKESINSLLDMVLKFTHSPIEIKQLVLDAIDEERATNVQPVVYCKDCKHRKERHYEESDEKPYIKYECKFTKYSMSDEGFCSFGAKMLEKPNLQLLKNAVELIQKAKEIKVDGVRMDGEQND